MRYRHLVIGGLLAVATAGCDVGIGRAPVTIHTGEAGSAEGAISIEADGWTYSVPLDGVMWVDTLNSWHESGRPDCLPPTGATRPVTFGAVDVSVEGVQWRPVVWVSCR
jgi:hypothetical protein